MSLNLSFFGAGLSLRGDAEALEELGRDFAWFRGGPPANAGLELARVRPATLPGPERLWPRLPRYRVADAGLRRRVLYADDSALEWDFERKTGRAEAESLWRLREIGYLTALSRIGEALEDEGWHRVHALGFTRGGGAGLLLLPSGGGKSVLGYEMLRREGWDIMSDDTPLVSSDGVVRPFPLRLGFLPDRDLSAVPAAQKRTFRRLGRPDKTVVDVSFFRDKIAEESPLRWLIVGRRRPGLKTSVRPATEFEATLALLDALVLGRGIAQLSELMFRPGWASGLPRLAARRWAAARALVSVSRPLALEVGNDPGAALSALELALV